MTYGDTAEELLALHGKVDRVVRLVTDFTTRADEWTLPPELAAHLRQGHGLISQVSITNSAPFWWVEMWPENAGTGRLQLLLKDEQGEIRRRWRLAEPRGPS